MVIKQGQWKTLDGKLQDVMKTKIGNVLGKRVLWFENEIDTSQLKAPSSEQEWEKPKKSEMANPRL